MVAKVDEELCVGCGVCNTSCPEVFEMADDKVKVIVDIVPEGAVECCKQAKDECPVEAIIIEE